jgi:hypothetical protein
VAVFIYATFLIVRFGKFGIGAGACLAGFPGFTPGAGCVGALGWTGFLGVRVAGGVT